MEPDLAGAWGDGQAKASERPFLFRRRDPSYVSRVLIDVAVKFPFKNRMYNTTATLKSVKNG